jgi:anti-sigma B factor antagonist
MGIPVSNAFKIDVVEGDDRIVVRVDGELDVATAPALDDALQRAEASAVAVITIDLAGVSFIDSTGLRALLEAHARDTRHPAPGRLEIAGGSKQAQKLFKLAGVLDKLPFVAPLGQ